MKACINCGLCYQDPFNNTYRCMRGSRQPIEDLFILNRLSCDKHVYVDLVIKTEGGK